MARILVVGGSLGGLLAAGLLLRAGHEVQVLERSAQSLEGRGAGIVTHDALRTALRAAGAVVDQTLGIQVASRVVLGADGQTLHHWDYPQVLTSWGRLYTLLRAAVPDATYRLGAAVAAVQQDEHQVTATLANGQSLSADLLVAADGIRSTLRQQLAPAAQAHYAGYVAWRGLCDEAVLSQFTRRTLFPHFGFGVPEGEQLIGYPVAGAGDSTAPGERRWNFVWYRPTAAGAALEALMTDADGRHHPEGISPQRMSWRCVAAVREVTRQKLAPQFAEIVEKTAMPFVQPVYDLQSQQVAFGRVALLGDAAFVARPHMGMGVTKAGDDALALAAALATHGATALALQHYEQARLPAGSALVARGRQLGAYLQAYQGATGAAQSSPAGDPGDAGGAPRDRAYEVMRQTAIDSQDSEALRFTPTRATQVA
jgi:2-polyprenyl-6-methoxyphenol hydroxylase-like FAD-dependent oxidoreductase